MRSEILSYIRCTSNPEGLYIYQSDAGIHITVLNNSLKEIMLIPNRHWNELARYVIANYGYLLGRFKYGQFSVYEKSCMIYFELGNKRIKMCEVTWEYISTQLTRQYMQDKDNKIYPARYGGFFKNG